MLNMKLLVRIGLIVCCTAIIAGCQTQYAEKPKQNAQITNVEQIGVVSFKMIKTSGNEIIGYLEETENMVKGKNMANGQEKKKIYYVYDTDIRRIGFITEHGTVSVYRYTKQGAATQVARGEVYTINAGTKKLLGYEGQIYYDDYEPLPPWRR